QLPKITFEKEKTEETKPEVSPQQIKTPSEAFSQNKAGRRIVKIIELYNYMDNPTTENGKEALDELQKLRETPKETFDEIRKGTFMLSDFYEVKKQFLVQFASTLDVDKEEKIEFLKEGIERSLQGIHDSNNIQATYTPTIIFDTFINVSEDSVEIEKLATEMMTKSPVEVQKNILTSYNRINPEKAGDLARKYSLNAF
ncbi:MAG: hypothetical protein V1647_03255, partial [Pseudomonadota bacterium]